MEELTLSLIIEGMRDYMMKLAEEKGTLLDPEVVAISQTLDTYIVQLTKLKMKRSVNIIEAV